MKKTVGSKHESLDQMVYDRLRSMIINRELLPGSQIYQDQVALELGVSRTPLMGALKKLEMEQLVTYFPRRGYVVRVIAPEEMVEIFEIRAVLEGLAARKLSETITKPQIKQLSNFFKKYESPDSLSDFVGYAKEDREFHFYIIDLLGDCVLNRMLQTHHIQTISYLANGFAGLIRPPKDTLPEHQAMIEAICNKHPEEAERLTRLHLENSRKKLQEERK